VEERYPYIRFVIDAAQVIAAALALVILVAGTFSSCHQGGFGGVVSFVILVVVAAVVYVAVMVRIESLRVFLDIESSTRQLVAASHPPAAPAPGPPGTVA
jgi:fatty acid desaturase